MDTQDRHALYALLGPDTGPWQLANTTTGVHLTTWEMPSQSEVEQLVDALHAADLAPDRDETAIIEHGAVTVRFPALSPHETQSPARAALARCA